MDSKKKKTMLIILFVILGVILLVLGFYLMKRKNTNDIENDKKDQLVEYNIPAGAISYKNSDKVIYLVEIENDSSNFGPDPHTYELYANNNKIKVYNSYKRNTFVVYNDNNWYFLNENTKSIISFYESKNKIKYHREDDKQEWYVIYEYDNDKIVSIVNEKDGQILSFKENFPDEYRIHNEIVYLRFDNSISTYNSNGKILQEKKYEKILSFNFRTNINSPYSLVYDNNEYYFLSLADNKSTKLEKKDVYEGNNKKLDIYSLESLSNQIYEELLLSYDGEYYTSPGLSENTSNDYNNIFVSSIKIGVGQYFYGSFLVNTKNKKIVSFNIGGSNSIHKTNDGYYFAYSNFTFGDDPFANVYTDGVTTSTGKKLSGKGMYSLDGNYITIQNENSIIKYDINGNTIKNLKTDKIYLLENGYALIKLNNKFFVVNIANDFNQKEVEIDNSINLEKIKIYELNENLMTYMDENYKQYKYDFNTKKIEKNN